MITAGRNPAIDADSDRLVDIANLSIACNAYANYLKAANKEKDAHFDKGVQFHKRYIAGLENSLVQIIEPLLEQVPRLKPLYNRALKGSPEDKVTNSADFFIEFFRWVKVHQNVAKSTFAGRAYRAAQKIMMLAVEDSPQAQLNQAAAIPSMSGLNIIRKWIEKAAELAGVPITTIESVVTDAETANAVVEKVKNVETQLSVAEPLSEEAAELKEKKQELHREIEEIAADSKAPKAVMTSVVTNLAKEPESKEAERLGLDAEQKKAMLAEGKVVIAASAGSGKTRTLISKMAYLVNEKHYRPEQILATTFTKKAAIEMQERTEKYGIYGAKASTTHSIALGIVNQHGSDYDKKAADKGPERANKLWNIAVAQIQMRPTGPIASDKVAWGNKPYYNKGGYGGGYKKPGANINALYKTPVNQWFNLGIKMKDESGKKIIGNRMLRTASDNFANHGIKADEAWVKAKDKEGSVEYAAAAAYGAYEWLKKNNPEGPCYDFNDFLSRAVDILKENPRARDIEQSKYKVVLVDECQDLNQQQHELFKIMSEKADTVAYVGDINQAIFGWRGAAPEEMEKLVKEKGFKVENISTSYRCGENIIDAANKLIANNEPSVLTTPTKPTDGHKGKGKIEAHIVPTHEAAAETVADQIKASLDEASAGVGHGVEIVTATPNDFGIMVRNNGERDAYQAALISRGIPYVSKNNYFDNSKVKSLTWWLTIASIGQGGATNDEINDAVSNAHQTPGYMLGKEFVGALQRTCPKGMNFYDYLVNHTSDVTRAAYPDQAFRGRNIEAYVNVMRSLVDFSKDAKTTAREVMAKIIELEGVAKNIDGSMNTFMDALVDDLDLDDVSEEGEKPNAEEMQAKALAPLRPLMNMAEHQQDPAKCLAFIRKMKQANDKTAKKEDSKEPAVQIDTIHQWKGLERKHVYVAMAAGTFPYYGAEKAYEAGDKKALDEERRLAYVALTRGAESVEVLCPMVNYMGKKAGVSRFVTEAGLKVIGDSGEVIDPGTIKTSSIRETPFGEYLIRAIMASENGYEYADESEDFEIDAEDLFEEEI